MRGTFTFEIAFTLGVLTSGCGDTEPDPSPPIAGTSANAGAPAQATQGAPPEVLEHIDDWPLPNGDYENSRAHFGGRIDSTSIGMLTERWRVPLENASVFGYVTSNPLILGDTVYLQDMGSEVLAIDRASGAVRWQNGLGGQTVGPNGVAVGWGRVYGNLGDTGFFALDVEDGQELWRYEPTLVSSEGVDIQPSVFDGLVLVSTVPANVRSGYAGGARGVIVALDAMDGLERWRFDTVDSDDIWGNAEVNGGGGAWYPPLVDPERGLTYWGTGNPSPFPGTLDQPNGSSRPGPNLYTSSVVALSADGGELQWYHQERPHDLLDYDFQNPPMLVRADEHSDHRDMVIGSGKTGTVVALDPDTGELLWRTSVGRHDNDDLEALPVDPVTIYPGVFGGVLTPTAYAEGIVYVPVVNLPFGFSSAGLLPATGDINGALVALDVRNGTPLWTANLPAPCYGAATVINDLVLTSDAEGHVYAFDRTHGTQVWTYDAPTGINAPLAATDDLLLIPAGMTANGPALIALGL